MDYSSDQNISQIISSLSHELRTPLTILSSNLQLLKSNNLNLEATVRAETFQLCEEALNSVTKFLDGIHFLNLANKQELRAQPEVFELDQLVHNVLNKRNTSFYGSDRIQVDPGFKQKQVCTDQELLTKVLIHILDNAYKFSAKEVFVKMTVENQHLIIEVEDQGVGIPADEMSLIFMPFYRCENVKMLSGTGLGLSIAHKAIKCLNGEIEITSAIKKGTKVKLKILLDEC
ncbi:sensor histidine kinase [Sunxiuqinia dokdonensis]|uniref:sensor histidine kinase n=1 Tax=Sunxiuqinia dokdonensis TaxID=1409788 RepID=UPI0009EB17F4|nr:HAMP domain-containing sensor histidine kinase [Sunxiuqinia dokdonensis]